jgi:hypothetical protein
MNAGELIEALKKLPPESVVYFKAKQTSLDEISGLSYGEPHPRPDTGCPHCDDTSELNPNLFLPRVILTAEDHAQVNKLMEAVDALVAAAPDQREALRIKMEAGVFLSPDELKRI